MNSISDKARISSLADIETSNRGSVVTIGAGAVIDSFVKIKFAGGSGNIDIGPNSYINSGTVLYSGHGIRIGAHVLIAANCTLSATNHAYSDRSRRIAEQGFMPSRGGIVIEDDCWIGANCVLLDGSHLQQGCVIAAGSVIRGRTEPYKVYAGDCRSVIGERRNIT